MIYTKQLEHGSCMHGSKIMSILKSITTPHDSRSYTSNNSSVSTTGIKFVFISKTELNVRFIGRDAELTHNFKQYLSLVKFLFARNMK